MIELATRSYSANDQARAIAAVFAASTTKVPSGWTRTLTAGPTAILYRIPSKGLYEEFEVSAAMSGVTISIGSRRVTSQDDLSTFMLCHALATAEVAGFGAWLDLHCTPLAIKQEAAAA